VSENNKVHWEEWDCPCFIHRICKVLPNKDHATCGKERFIGTRLQDCHSFGFRVQWLGWKWVVAFIGGAKLWGRERDSGLWLSEITRWNRLTCLANWVTGSSWVGLQAEKQSGRETSRGETSSHKSGGLVLVLASGPSAHPKSARDLTESKFDIFLVGLGWMVSARNLGFWLS
jgi:hypothetical protein